MPLPAAPPTPDEAADLPASPAAAATPACEAARPSANTTRRRLMMGGAAAAVSPWLLGSAAQAAVSRLEAYASATSVVQGGQIHFHLRNPDGSLTRDVKVPVNIVRIAHPDVLMRSATAPVRNRSVPADASVNGCGWPVSYTLSVARKWPSGVYLARFGSGSAQTEVPFVVRPAKAGKASRILVQVQFTTLQAYNAWGGKSLYDYNSSGNQRASRVSFNRPLEHTVYEGADPWVPPFVRWLAKNGIAAEFCTSIDLHHDSSLLAPYQLFITVGHDEYWSRAMRERLDTFVWAGGNAISFSGNTCWWQVRLEADSAGTPDRSLVCYKSHQADPVADPALKTVNWIDLSPAWPENATLGLGFTHGAIWANGLPRPATPYVVYQPGHWAFAGTGLLDRATFGSDIVGYETDALDLAWSSDGRPAATGADGAPRNLQVLAVADAGTWAAQARALGSEAQSGLAVIGVYTQGGTVFAAGSIDWVHGLLPELQGRTPSPVSRITRNVIERLQSPESPDAPVNESLAVYQYHVPQLTGDGSRHFLSLSAFVETPWVFDRIAFHSVAASAEGAVPVYQYHADQSSGDGARYYYALSAEVGNGWTLDGLAFHAYAQPQPGAQAVYQYHTVQADGDGWRFFFSTDPAEAGGWLLDAPVFYVPVTTG